MHRISTDIEYLQSGKIIIDADGIPVDLGYRGTGFPEGRVTAPVGSIYTDQAATGGAIRWIKKSGTGATGWAVEYGDTGWRNITSLATNIVAGYGSIVFRQLNGVARLIFDIQLDPSTTDSTVIPSGGLTAWAPAAPSPGAKGTATEVNTSRTYRTLMSRLGSFTIYGAPRGTVLNGEVMWTADRIWTTLPGLPA